MHSHTLTELHGVSALCIYRLILGLLYIAGWLCIGIRVWFLLASTASKSVTFKTSDGKSTLSCTVGNVCWVSGTITWSSAHTNV